MASTSQRRCVFVGNIPYDVTEEQLVEICSEVGPVVSFRLVTDRETGKPKGYGFCEYKDEETALSARRNLQGYQINGRQLRVDFAENDKNSDKNREQGHGGPGMVASTEPQKQTRGAAAVHGESASHQPVGLQLAITAASVMTGALGGPQIGLQSAQNTQQTPTTDPLTLHLSKMSRNQLTEIVSSLKVMATQNKEQARQLLLSRPQLLKAVFQAQIILGMVTPQVLQTPNILQTPLHNPQQSAKPATLNLPGLPQVAQKAQPQTLLTHKQLPTPQHVSIQPFVQNPQQGKINLIQQTPLPMASRVSTLQPPRHPNVRPPTTQVTNSLNQPSSQMHLPNNILQSSLPGPQVPDSGLQAHLPSDAQSVLLEQVLNLTPEQLNSLAPEQRQQIVQLQQGLKRERMLAAAKNNY